MIAYQPALDGVRALAVAAVLLFHGEIAGFGGGYLGVSVFFTLSGFLITSLLAAEIDKQGSVGLGAFYARRARRLLPASVLLVVLVMLASIVTDWFDGVADLRAHIVGSLLQVANWVFLASGGSYQELLQQAAGAASPLEHYWSLAIEEQFYWLWPVAFVGIWKLGRNTRGRLWILGGITAAFVVAAPVTAAVWGSDAAYWASPARAAEILLGALLALAIAGRSVPTRCWVLAPVALAVLAVCIVAFPTAGGPAYAGWLPAIGVVSSSLLLGLQVDSPVRTALSAAPLVWLGKVSYGVYLFHWPIFVVLNSERVGIDGPLLFVVRAAVTLTAAQLSFTFFEQPVRRASGIGIRPTMTYAAATTAGVIVAAIVVVPGAGSDYWSTSDDVAEAAALDTDDTPLLADPEAARSTTTSAAANATGNDATGNDDAGRCAGQRPGSVRHVEHIEHIEHIDADDHHHHGHDHDDEHVAARSRPRPTRSDDRRRGLDRRGLRQRRGRMGRCIARRRAGRTERGAGLRLRPRRRLPARRRLVRGPHRLRPLARNRPRRPGGPSHAGRRADGDDLVGCARPPVG